MPKYAAMTTVTDRDFQNVQELATLWGEIAAEIETNHDAELKESYATLGEYDFIVIYDVEDQDDAFQVALSIERHGLDTQTMAIEDTDNFAELVDDI
ncbi:GYD domain-containing protein [Halostella sp. PRR32]|uniref:GYD domain-containing protein n=1 Tax=Halostella sp. PRR32 TaxID=3098147 RepID=UPI002B1E03DD|nr:GYD domain-containing protein [Halostella sp. PRR32]